MKAKKIVFISVFHFITLSAIMSADITIDYFGQEPPGNTPQPFANEFISEFGRSEANPMFSPDGTEFYFTITDPPSWSYSKTMVSKFEDGSWSVPAKIDFGGSSIDWGHCFLPDGNTMLFNSSTSNWVLDIWSVSRTETGWSEAVKLPESINDIGSEIAKSVSSDSVLYFRSGIPNADADDLYYSEIINGVYSNPVYLEYPVNTSDNEYDPVYYEPDSCLLFTIKRQSDANDRDICISFKKGRGEWTNPKTLVTSAQVGSITPDNNYLLFCSPGIPIKISWVAIDSLINDARTSNFIPYKKNDIPNQHDTVENIFSYTIPDSIFIDDDGIETLTITAMWAGSTNLPGSLTLDPLSRTLSGKLDTIGNFTIEITATDEEGISIADQFELTVVDKKISLLNSSETSEIDLNIWPNPANHSIHLSSGINLDELKYSIVSSVGNPVKEGNCESGTIILSELPEGIYFIQFHQGSRLCSKKLVIVR